jgi:DUF218 domain
MTIKAVHILLGVLLFTFISCAYSTKRAQRLLSKASEKKYDIIIVPGVPLVNGKWDSTMKARVYWSKYLFDRGITRNVMYSGSAVYSPYYEAEVMAIYAEAIGIPAEHIFTETKAEHSTENMYYGYHKSKLLGFKSIALASDPFQAKQLSSYAKLRLSTNVGIIPIVLDTLKAMEPNMIDPVLNFEKAFNDNFVSIVERESKWKRLKGTISWNIDKGAYKVKK